jgi:ABC-type antimicrobial peptide transport system permease subunit
LLRQREISAVGIYGVLVTYTNQRTREIGIRIALEAGPGKVYGMVMRQAGWKIGAGLLLGMVAALLSARFLSTLIFGLSPYDPFTLVGGPVFLLAVGGLASWLPARRAARLDSVEALRAD